ncbi:MAG: prephenate dehydrogenase [Actinomycetota bacterium]|nr:prephenate dehydrogenase [Actinomycetota bacterium]
MDSGAVLAAALQRPVCVLGLGLIGGSLLRAVADAGREAWGASASTTTAEKARADGYDVADDVATAARRAAEADALVVVAVPLTAMDDVLAVVGREAPDCRLTDVTSVKEPVAEAVGRRAPAARFVGGHPMTGTEFSGWDAGSLQLFHDKVWVVATDDDTDLEVWTDVVALALACGATVVPAASDEHDVAVARISHLPHLLAAVLAAVGADGGELALALAAGSFTDGTRVAATRPELTAAMCEGNRAALLAALDDALGRLGAARGSLASTGGLLATLTAGHDGRASLDAARLDRREVRIDLVGVPAEHLEAMRELGRSGGRIIGWTSDALEAAAPDDE